MTHTKNRTSSINSLRMLRAEKSNIWKIGLYAVVQRTMPETARTIFRFLMRLHLGVLSFASRLRFDGSASGSIEAAMLEQGCRYLRLGRIEEATAEFKMLLKKSPTNENAALWLTRTMLIQGNYLGAQKVLFRAIAWHSDSIPLRRQLAGLLHTTGSYWEAEAEYKKLLRQFQNGSIDVFLGLAALAFAEACNDEAFEWYQHALQIDPKNLSAALGIIECARYSQQAQTVASELKTQNCENNVIHSALQKNRADNSESILQSPKSAKHKGTAVLIIDHFLPSTGSSAGSIHLYEIIKLFRDTGCHVTVIGRNGEYQRRSRLQLEAMGVETFATDPERLIAWNYRSAAPKIDFSGLLKKNRYVLAFLTRYNIAGVYMELLREHAPNLPIAIDTEDVHFVREERKRLLYGSTSSAASELRSKELEIYDQADCLIAVSDPDARVLREHFPAKTIFTIPLIYQTSQSNVPFSARKDLLFVGNFVHPPNSDAVVHYSGRILPLLKAKLPEVKTYVAGANSTPLLESFASDNLILTGYVPAMQPFLDSCKINVAPLRYGAGMNGKILESMAAGLPVVTTPVVAEGIADSGGMIVAEDPDEFADAVAHLYNDERLWNSIRDRAYDVIQTRYTPEVVAKEIDQLLTWATQQQ